jgi:hypothetical protein
MLMLKTLKTASIFPGKPGRFGAIAALLVLASCATHSPIHTFQDAMNFSANPTLPDPLVALDGHRITSRSEWFKRRKPELEALFQHYMYGAIPPAPAHIKTELVGEYPDFLEGKATLKLLRVVTGPGTAPKIDLMLVIPKQQKRAACFLAMNFCGNEALSKDSRIPLPQSWMGNNCGGADNRATDACRGKQATDWPLEEIVKRGYALASFYSGDIDSDRGDASTGLYEWLAGGDVAKNQPANRGTLAAWAWGFQRCVDYLVTDAAIDPHRIAAVGHSRNGKTALLAAAFDSRIAMAFPHQAGCGGTAPSRGKVGESVKAINDHFPHWFNAEFKKFNDAPEKLPFDQNCMVALCAPRPVLFSAAQEDQWSNPAGQFEVLKAASPVYEFLGVEGLTAQEMPPQRQLVSSRLGYYIREGKHSMTADDWNVFMNFADHNWPKAE